MRIAKTLVWFGTLAMAAALIYGFTVGDFSGEGNVLFSMPWGIVSLVDVYVGFAFFCVWVVYREAAWWRSALWITAIAVLGNLMAGIYALIALYTCGDDWDVLWKGKRA